MSWRGCLAASFLPALALAACGADAPPPAAEATVPFDSATVWIVTTRDTIQLHVDVATTEVQRRHGLMERLALPAHHGMLFLNDTEQDGTAGFYMFRTRIPLDIAFAAGDGRIVAILSMTPCASPNPSVCHVYAPGVPYTMALETNMGYFAQHGVQRGDRIEIQR